MIGVILVWFGLVWFGLVWFGLVWFAKRIPCSFPSKYAWRGGAATKVPKVQNA